MRTHKRIRAAARVTGLLLGTVVAVGMPSVAQAAPPTGWNNNAGASPLEVLLVLGGIPLAVIAVVALLTYLPSMIRRQATDPGLAFSEHPQWFGGPGSGFELPAAASADTGSTGSTVRSGSTVSSGSTSSQSTPSTQPGRVHNKGGASARW